MPSDRSHGLWCWPHRVWRRYHYHQPFWRDDKTAKMLGIAHKGCPYCGRGAA